MSTVGRGDKGKKWKIREANRNQVKKKDTLK